MKIPKPKPIRNVVRTPEEYYDIVVEGRGPKPRTGRLPDEWVKPEKVAAVLAGLAAGQTQREIQAATGQDRAKISRIAARYGDSLTETRKETAKLLAHQANSCLDLLATKMARLEDNPDLLDEISPDKLSLTAAMLIDKAAMLEGMATQKVEITKGVSFEDAKKAIEEAKMKIAKGKVIDAELA